MPKQQFDIRYLFPNFFTALSIFVGVVAIIAAIKGDTHKAAWFIFISLILDGLDGRIARWTNACSEFGVEFDSLADIVAFGVAPAVLFYVTIGWEYGRFGTMVAALYVVFGAIRLARFNILAPSSEPTYFLGLPIPTAAAFVAAWTLLYLDTSIPIIKPILLYGTLLVALLMVSNIRYPSFKKVSLQKRHVIRAIVILTIFLAILYLYPPLVLAVIVTSYVVLGIIRAIYYLSKRRVRSE